MNEFLAGGSAIAAAAAALFFLRFWRQTADRFFALFAVAFALMALNRVGVGVVDDARESGTWLYAPRLLAFLLIIAAIVDKNRTPTPRKRGLR